MKIVFSGHFDSNKNPERVKFLSRMLEYDTDKTISFIVFNQSDVCKAPFDVFNIDKDNKEKFTKPILKKFLKKNILADNSQTNWLQKNHQANKIINEIISESANVISSKSAIRVQLRKLIAFNEMLNNSKPDLIFLWNQFNVFHRLASILAKNNGIPVAFFHDGVLPGSVALDFDGEMGESWISREPERFLKIKVSKQKLTAAKEFINFIQEADFNRHKQIPSIDFELVIKNKQIGEKPVVLICGQNDWHAGIKPENSKRTLHSPHFTSSLDLLEEVDRLANRYNFHVLYKPHPNDKERYCFLKAEDFPNSTIIANAKIEEMIDYADVTMTIASQACYTAAIRSKPCILVGINQMSGKGISFDLQNRSELGALIERAITQHDPKKQRQALIQHVAQLNEVYLYDFNTLDTNFYINGAEDALLAIKSFSKSLELKQAS